MYMHCQGWACSWVLYVGRVLLSPWACAEHVLSYSLAQKCWGRLGHGCSSGGGLG